MTIVKRAAAPLLILILGLLTACTPAGAPQLPGPSISEPETSADLTRADVESWLDGRVPAALERGSIPGASVAVVHDGKVLTTRGYGWATTGAGDEPARPVDPTRTLFRVGSVAKIATATAVMQLVEDGRVELDADIDNYVDVDIDRRFDDDITLRHLLTHTAGFEERSRGTFLPEDTTVDLADIVRTDPPVQVFRPGTTPAYSNYGLTLAGYIVQQVSGQPFDDYVADRIFTPAGMSSSTFAQPLPERLSDRMASGYTTSAAPEHPFEIAGVSPAGAMTSTTEDMARFMLAQLGQLDDGQLLSARTRDLMQTPALNEDTLGTLAQGQRMALGWFDQSRNGHRVLSHGGDSQFFHAMVEIYPDDATGIFIVMNGNGEGTANQQLRTDLTTGFTDRYFSGDNSDGQPEVAPTESQGRAERVQGTYETTRSTLSTYLTAPMLLNTTELTALSDGRLLVQADPMTGAPGVFEEVSPWVWQEVEGYRRLAVQVEDGRVVRIGHDAAFSLVPVTPVRAALLPTAAVSVLALVVVLGTWAGGSIKRRTARRGSERPDRTHIRGLPRTAQLARWGALSGLLAAIGWLVVISALPPGGAPPATGVRFVQALQVLGVAGIVPSALALVQAVRQRVGVGRIIAGAILLLALIGLAWVAWTAHLLSPDISI